MGSNGKGKRPFGPHGEGCECDPETDQTAEEAHPPEEESRGVKYVSLHHDDLHPIEVIMSGVSVSYASAFITAADVCTMDGVPLTNRQLVHLMAGIMKGHALARESAQIIWANFYRAYAEANPEPEQASAKSPAQSALQDISELFYQKPEDGDEA